MHTVDIVASVIGVIIALVTAIFKMVKEIIKLNTSITLLNATLKTTALELKEIKDLVYEHEKDIVELKSRWEIENKYTRGT